MSPTFELSGIEEHPNHHHLIFTNRSRFYLELVLRFLVVSRLVSDEESSAPRISRFAKAPRVAALWLSTVHIVHTVHSTWNNALLAFLMHCLSLLPQQGGGIVLDGVKKNCTKGPMCCTFEFDTAHRAHLDLEPRETVFSQNHPLSSSLCIEPLNFQKIFIGFPTCVFFS